MNKEKIRGLVRKRRCELDSEWIEEKSFPIQQSLSHLPEFVEADIVSCYLAMPFEVRTDRIIEKCWQEDKTVCVPAFRRSANRYDLTRVEKNTSIVEGPWKIPEPAETAWISSNEVDLIVVPGMAFDPHCGRLGHGGGHYDRIMKNGQDKLFKVGLAFEFQVFDLVPMDERDVCMDAVVTEERVIRAEVSVHGSPFKGSRFKGSKP